MTSITFKQGDCMQHLPKLPSGCIDLVIADLPYGITHAAWDTALDLDKLWAELKRVAKPNAAFLMFGTRKFSIMLANSNLKDYRYKYVWIKNKSTNFLGAKVMPLFAHEDILVFYAKLPTYTPIMQGGEAYTRKDKANESKIYNLTHKPMLRVCRGGRYPNDVITCPLDQKKHKRGIITHSTQKPLALLERLIKTYTKPGELVLDPTAGLCSTGVAAMHLGRSFVGYELYEPFYRDGCTRLKYEQGGLFNTQVKLNLGEQD